MDYLVDTSVWIDHLNHGNSRLTELLEENRVFIHPFITGEIACGNLSNRDEIMLLLGQLRETAMASHDEALYFLKQNRLHGKGVGWIDVHLLASCALDGLKLFTLDKRLQRIGDELL